MVIFYVLQKLKIQLKLTFVYLCSAVPYMTRFLNIHEQTTKHASITSKSGLRITLLTLTIRSVIVNNNYKSSSLVESTELSFITIFC